MLKAAFGPDGVFADHVVVGRAGADAAVPSLPAEIPIAGLGWVPAGSSATIEQMPLRGIHRERSTCNVMTVAQVLSRCPCMREWIIKHVEDRCACAATCVVCLLGKTLWQVESVSMSGKSCELELAISRERVNIDSGNEKQHDVVEFVERFSERARVVK